MPTYPYPVNVAVAVPTPPGSDIYYTTDGVTDPTEASTPYTAPVLVTESTEIRARGYYPGYVPSLVATINITIGQSNFFGYSALTALNEAQIIAISNAPLENTFVGDDSLGTYTFGAGAGVSDYFYFWWPDSFTVPQATIGFKLVASGFPIPMAGVAEGFTNGPTNGWYYLNVAVNGVAGKLFRTFYQVGSGSAQQILVS